MFKVAQIQLGSGEINAAGTAKNYHAIVSLPGKWLVKTVKILSNAAMTANGTNYCTHTITNATQSLTIATRAYNATDVTAGQAETQTLTAGLASVVSKDDVIKLAITHSGTGLASQNVAILELEQAPLP